jgi:hypothetical protein
MKSIKLIACLLLLIVTFGGCAPERNEGFSIYLLARDTPVSTMPVLSHLELAERPLIPLSDIVSYTEATHDIELTDKAYGNISKLDVPVSGKVFVVCVGHHPVYWGAFWTPISSISFEGVAILKPLASDRPVIQVQLGYPSPEFFTGEDPRSNPEILRSLKQAGKLR